jgi:hypothetical protein
MKLKTIGATDSMTVEDRVEKRILLTEHQSTDTLKREIRKTILSHAKIGWTSYKIFCQNQFVYLEFEGKKNEITNR